MLWVLYDRVLRVDPGTRDDPERDRFLLSKGHGPAGVLRDPRRKGFLDVDDLRDFGGFDSRLGYHPDHLLVPGVEISSGSLGHGLPIAVGQALALDARGRRRAGLLPGGRRRARRGQQLGGRAARGPPRTGPADRDRRRQPLLDHHWPRGVAARFELEGWSAARVDGRDHDAIEQALRAGGTAPHVVVAEVAR